LRIADLPRGTAALFACSANERAFEHDDWKHGAFTRALLATCQRLSRGGKVRANELAVPVHDMVQSLVSSKTNGRSSQTVHLLINGIVDLQLKLSKAQQLHQAVDALIDEAHGYAADQPEFAKSLLTDLLKSVRSANDVSPELRKKLERRILEALKKIRT
jgi:hypothetical protein